MGTISARDRTPANIARILSHSRLFYGMPPASLYDLISRSRIEDVEGGGTEETSLRPNDLRIVLEGDLRIVSDGSTLGRGNFLGETSLLDLALAQELDSVRVHSVDGCSCLVITPHEMNAWMERHPRLQSTFYRHLAQELFNRCLSPEILRKAG